MNTSNSNNERIEHRTCPLCAHKETKILLVSKDFKFSKQDFDISECLSCGMVFTRNPPEEIHAGYFYQDPGYISHSDSKKGIINRLYHISRSFMLKKKRHLIEKETSGRRLLDIGSGTGYFLNEMKINGWNADGVEISESARNFCEINFGIKPYYPHDITGDKLSTGYDVISLWHVLEHVYDPDQYLNKIFGLLAQNGILVLALPNSCSADAKHYREFWAGYDVPRHLWHFSPETIEKLLCKHHFTLHRSYRMPLDGYYVSMLSESYRSGGFLSIIRGVTWGFMFHIKSLLFKNSSSSLIYLFKKTN